jgi:chromosome segregation ATPase
MHSACCVIPRTCLKPHLFSSLHHVHPLAARQAGAVSHDFKAATPQLVRQVTPYRAHQQQALADAKATIHPLKGQLCRERCLSKRHLAAALEQADTAAAYLQQVSRLQLALVREGAERVLAEAEAARQCALVGSIEQEVADLTTQLAALQQQLQQQASSAGKALRQAGYEKDMAGLKVEQLAAKLQQQAASSEAALTQAQGERDAAQQQVQGLSTQLQQVQGQLAGCQQELVEARAALPTPEQVAAQQQQQEQLQQQLQQWYEGYQALHAAYAQQGTMLQQVVSERDSAVHQLQQVTVARDEQQQQLTETQQQLQQITGERDSLAQQLGAVVAVCDTKQQQLAAVTQECERLAHTLQGVEQELEVTSEHLEGECAKGNMLQAALNELLATAAPGKVVGVGLLGDTVGDGAQGEVQMVSLQVQLRDGVTPEQAAAAGLTPPAALGQPWVEGAVRKLGDADRAVQEVAITALATLKGAVTGTVLGPRLRHVELGPPGQKPSLFLEKWDGNLRELVTQVRGCGTTGLLVGRLQHVWSNRVLKCAVKPWSAALLRATTQLLSS